MFTGFNNLRDAHYRLWNPITERVTIVHDATFVETKLTRHWYENLLLGEDINFSGGDHGTLDINDLFDPIIPTDFQSEATNSNDQIEIAEEEQYYKSRETDEDEDMPGLLSDSESENESDDEYWNDSDSESEEESTESKHQDRRRVTINPNVEVQVNNDMYHDFTVGNESEDDSAEGQTGDNNDLAEGRTGATEGKVQERREKRYPSRNKEKIDYSEFNFGFCK